MAQIIRYIWDEATQKYVLHYDKVRGCFDYRPVNAYSRCEEKLALPSNKGIFRTIEAMVEPQNGSPSEAQFRSDVTLDFIEEMRSAGIFSNSRAEEEIKIIKKMAQDISPKDRERPVLGSPVKNLTAHKKDFKGFYHQWPASNPNENPVAMYNPDEERFVLFSCERMMFGTKQIKTRNIAVHFPLFLFNILDCVLSTFK